MNQNRFRFVTLHINFGERGCFFFICILVALVGVMTIIWEFLHPPVNYITLAGLLVLALLLIAQFSPRLNDWFQQHTWARLLLPALAIVLSIYTSMTSHPGNYVALLANVLSCTYVALIMLPWYRNLSARSPQMSMQVNLLSLLIVSALSFFNAFWLQHDYMGLFWLALGVVVFGSILITRLLRAYKRMLQ